MKRRRSRIRETEEGEKECRSVVLVERKEKEELVAQVGGSFRLSKQTKEVLEEVCDIKRLAESFLEASFHGLDGTRIKRIAVREGDQLHFSVRR